MSRAVCCWAVKLCARTGSPKQARNISASAGRRDIDDAPVAAGDLVLILPQRPQFKALRQLVELLQQGWRQHDAVARPIFLAASALVAGRADGVEARQPRRRLELADV